MRDCAIAPAAQSAATVPTELACKMAIFQRYGIPIYMPHITNAMALRSARQHASRRLLQSRTQRLNVPLAEYDRFRSSAGTPQRRSSLQRLVCAAAQPRRDCGTTMSGVVGTHRQRSGRRAHGLPAALEHEPMGPVLLGREDVMNNSVLPVRTT